MGNYLLLCATIFAALICKYLEISIYLKLYLIFVNLHFSFTNLLYHEELWR